MTPRAARQKKVKDFIETVFGYDVTVDRAERTRRLLEKVLDLARAEKLTETEINLMISHCWNKPASTPAREICDVSVTLLAYCAATHISAETAEMLGVKNLTKLSVSDLLASQAVKVKKGIGRPVTPRREKQGKLFD